MAKLPELLVTLRADAQPLIHDLKTVRKAVYRALFLPLFVAAVAILLVGLFVGRASAQDDCLEWANPVPGNDFVFSPGDYDYVIVHLVDGSVFTLTDVVTDQRIDADQPIVALSKCNRVITETPTPEPTPTPTTIIGTPSIPIFPATPTPEVPDATPTPGPTPTPIEVLPTPTPEQPERPELPATGFGHGFVVVLALTAIAAGAMATRAVRR